MHGVRLALIVLLGNSSNKASNSKDFFDNNIGLFTKDSVDLLLPFIGNKLTNLLNELSLLAVDDVIEEEDDDDDGGEDKKVFSATLLQLLIDNRDIDFVIEGRL